MHLKDLFTVRVQYCTVLVLAGCIAASCNRISVFLSLTLTLTYQTLS